MNMDSEDGTSAFDRLREHYQEGDIECPECGHVDTDGEWTTEAVDGRVRYTHICPSCGAIETRELRFDEE